MSVPSVVSPPRYRVGDELASTLIHAVGILLSIAGLATLVAFAALRGDARAVVACAVFGSTLILLYTASTLYHAVPGELPRRVLRTLDHIAIFLLIAGTYTPFTLIVLPGTWGWGLFGTIWALALAGSALELGLLRRIRTRWLAVSIYVAMGWVALVAFEPLRTHLAPGGLALLIAGGATYTLGVPFYLCRWLPFHHAAACCITWPCCSTSFPTERARVGTLLPGEGWGERPGPAEMSARTLCRLCIAGAFPRPGSPAAGFRSPAGARVTFLCWPNQKKGSVERGVGEELGTFPLCLVGACS